MIMDLGEMIPISYAFLSIRRMTFCLKQEKLAYGLYSDSYIVLSQRRKTKK